MPTKKTIRKTFLILIPMLIILSIYCFRNEIKRHYYEKYLQKEYSDLNLTIETKKKSKLEQDKPELAGIQDYYMTIDPNLKMVPHERFVSAMRESRSILLSKSATSDLYDRYNWTEVPSNMGGRIRSFMIDPNDAENNYKKVWAGSVTGGLWYNNNIFSNDSIWHSVSDVWENLSISSIVADPNNKQIFYVGTGEPQTAVTIYRESSTRGVGIWKSSDGGDTWNLLPSTCGFPYISDIVVRNESGQSVIYAGVVSGKYMGEDHTPSSTDGLYRSADGGLTWTQVLPSIIGESEPYSPSDIEIAGSNRIFVGTYRNINGKGGAAILYSDNGLDWVIYDNYKTIIEANAGGVGQENIPGRVILASTPSSPNAIYAIIAAGRYTPQNWIYYRGKHLIRSSDNGVSWIQKTVPYGDPEETYWATLAWHALTIKVDPNNEDILYAGGLNIHKSVDGGTTWALKSYWYNRTGYPSYLHADQHSITFRPNSSDTVFFTNDGGVFSTYNASGSNIIFYEKNNSLNTLQFYSCDLNPDSASIGFIGGLQDNGTILYKGSPINYYSSVSGGDGAYCFFDDDDYIISTVYYNSIYITKKNNSNYQLYNVIDDYYGTGTFICPTGYDQQNKTFYANAVTFTNVNSNQLLRIKNITSLSYIAQLITLSTNSNVPFSSVHVSKFSTNTNTILLVGNQSGKLFKVNNAHLSPGTTSIGSNSFPTANISCIAEGETSDELLVTFSNYGVSSVWYTDNGGSSWIEIEGNLPDMPVRWALFDPENKNSVLLATEVGIWATENIHDASVNWVPVVKGLANVRVDMLRLRKSDNTILAATHGRGLYYCDLSGGTSIPDITISENNLFQLYPNPSKGDVKMKFNSEITEPIEIFVYTEEGSMVKSIRENKIVKDQVIDLNLTDNKTGFYVININYGNKNYSKKILIEK